MIAFLLTLSFLFTGPDGFTKIDTIWLPDHFILKDLMALGIGILVVAKSLKCTAIKITEAIN